MVSKTRYHTDVPVESNKTRNVHHISLFLYPSCTLPGFENGRGRCSFHPIEGILYKRTGDLKLLLAIVILVFLINLPFGYWRAGVRKFSVQWILAIHLPVPFVVACRIFLGLGWHISTFLFLIAAFFAGQLVGGKLQRLTDSL
jgi:hypothetical protein